MNIPFSLHCTICFEAFDLAERNPVVLPCGHTYLCRQCSKRLTKCMSCRAPLFGESKSVPMSPNQTMVCNGSERQHRGVGTISPPFSQKNVHTRQAEQEQLPIPNNVVLMALLESSQDVDKRQMDEDTAYESGDDDDAVREGIRQLNTTCGTFVVRDRVGLQIHAEHIHAEHIHAEHIHAEHPKDDAFSSNKENEDYCTEKSSKDCSEHCSELQFVISSDPSEDEKATEGQIEIRIDTSEEEEEELPYGQSVQVVSFEGGIARLARGRGYLKAKPDQLVKIGVAKDKACQVEGLLTSLNLQRDEMRRKLEEMDLHILKLNRNLSEAKLVAFVNPCPLAPVFTDEQVGAGGRESSVIVETKERCGNKGSAPTTPSSHTWSDSNFFSFLSAPHRSNSLTEAESDNRQANLTLPILASVRVGNENQGVALSPRISPSRSFGINFRTGLSGHRALTSSSSQVDRNCPDPSRGAIRMMGEHRGISHIRPIRRGNQVHVDGTPL